MGVNFKSTSGGDGTIEADVVIVGSTSINATEIAFLDGVTAGTVTASKAVVVDANKRIDTLVIADGGLKLGTAGGTAITSTAAELNILDGVTSTAAELNLVDGSVAGTTVASKAVVVDANKRIDTIVVADGGLFLGVGAGTAVTSTAAELNLIDGSIAGTAVASKAAVLGANKNLDVLVIADGGLALGAGAGTAVTSTAAELNILDGVTSTAAELNILDGVTATTAELNILDGVTSTAAELNFVDGSVAGTAVASKAAVLGTDKNLDVLALPVSGLKIGAGAGTAVDRTAAQLNLLTQGVAAGYKVARGSLTPVSASDTVVTGLATVVAVAVSFKGAPTLTHMFNAGDIGDQAGTPAAGSFLLKSYKPTATGDVTPTSSSTPWSACDWIAIGT